MKKVLKLILYLIVGAAVGLLVAITAQNIGGDVSTDGFYEWIGIIAASIAALAIIIGIWQYRRLAIVAKDYSKYMDEDAYDKYRYNKYNELTIYGTTAFILSLISLGILVIVYSSILLVSISLIIYVVSMIFMSRVSGLPSKLYPERQLPRPGDKNYADKLLAASDEGERHIMMTAFYKTATVTQVSMFIGVLVLIAYSLLTGESQIFSILVLGIIMIIISLKYSTEIKEK